MGFFIKTLMNVDQIYSYLLKMKSNLCNYNTIRGLSFVVLQQRSPKVTCTHTGKVTSSIIHHFKA